MKKNIELIEKYHNKLTNEVRRLTGEPIDDTVIERCNSEMFSILNEFVFERGKLYGVDLDQVTTPFDNEESFTPLTTDEILERAYDTMMESKPKDHSKNEGQRLVQNTEDKKQEFNRSESLTFDETDKEERWCKEHNDRYHRKDDEKKFKENPFHSGVSPVGRFVTVWQYCSISSWCECVCKDCYKKYKKAKKKLKKMSTCVQLYDADYKKQKQKTDEFYKRAVFTVRDIDE